MKQKKTFNFSNSTMAIGIAIGITIGIVFGSVISSGQNKRK